MQTPLPPGQGSPPRTAGIAIASLVLGILALSCFSILAGIPALVLGIVAINRIGKAGGALAGHGLAIAGIVLGGISFALLPIMAGFLLPAVSGARAAAQQAACLSNVKQCTVACIMYTQEHDATLPKSWGEVARYVNKRPGQSILRCRKERGAAISYAIVNPGKRLADLGPPEETIIVRETHANHRGKRAVGYADGHVEMRADKSPAGK